MSSKWHIVTGEKGGYSLIDVLVKNASDNALIKVKMIDGTIYTIDSDSSVGIGEESIMFKSVIDGKTNDALINTTFIISVEVIQNDAD